jgi:DNA mismatch endonuclease (patch repair protein)
LLVLAPHRSEHNAGIERDWLAHCQGAARRMDTIIPTERSALMGRIRSKDTKPEVAVRSMLHRLGYRFRLHRKDLPGRPDIVLPKHRKIILVQGCFWHGHTCRLASKPKSNEKYWSDKIATNQARDARNADALALQGWTVLELWECEVRRLVGLEEKLRTFLQG